MAGNDCCGGCGSGQSLQVVHVTDGAPDSNVEDNEDGTATITQADGTTCIVSTEKLDLSIVDGADTRTWTDLKGGPDRVWCSNPTFSDTRSGFGQTNAWATTDVDGAEGPVMDSMTIPFEIPKQGGTPLVHASTSVTRRTGNGVNGFALGRHFISIDGGPFAPLNTDGGSGGVTYSTNFEQYAMLTIIEALPQGKLAFGPHVAVVEFRKFFSTGSAVGTRILYDYSDATITVLEDCN